MTTRELSWTRRAVPLTAAALTCRAEDSGTLLSATLRRIRAGHALRIAAAPDGALVLGATDDLPWFPGAVYLGWDGGALTPTTRAPLPPVDLLLPSLRARLPAGHGLVALLPWAVLAAPMPRAPADAAAVEGLIGASAPAGVAAAGSGPDAP
jgi:hypothetical protein